MATSRLSLLVLTLAACTPNVPEKKPPKGALIETLAAGSNAVVVETIEPAASASPEALRQYLLSKAPIDHRAALADGFTATFGGETHVLRERHNRWYRCHAPVTDDAMRDDVIAVCKSYKLPAQ
ncbi:MAG TPA: hypothetical protein VMZ53_01865 [Kofleriaceae bacterium]|nr:hypothetical protein [Kofleriaceae bacterium]